MSALVRPRVDGNIDSSQVDGNAQEFEEGTRCLWKDLSVMRLVGLSLTYLDHRGVGREKFGQKQS